MKFSDAMKIGSVAKTLTAVGSDHCTSPLQPKEPSALNPADVGVSFGSMLRASGMAAAV